MNQRWACLRRQQFTAGDYSVSPVQPEHIESIRRWRNAQKSILRQKKRLTQRDQQAYYESNVWPQMAQKRPDLILLLFCLRELPIGYGGLVHIAWEHLRAEVSFLLAPERARDLRTYCREFQTFLGLIKVVAFEELGLQRLFTETFDVRPEHIKVLEDNGFEREGVMRRHVRIEGRPVDAIIHGCLS